MCLATRASSVARGCLRAAGNGSGPAAPSHILPHVCGRSRGRAGAERVPCGSCPRWGSPWGSGCFTLDPSPHPEAAALTPVGASGLVQWLWGTQDRSPSDLAELKAVLGHCIPQTHLCPRDPPAPHGARRLPSRTGTSVIHCCRARWVPGSPGPCPLPRCPSLMVQSRGAPPAVAAPAVSAPASLGRGELIPGAATTLSLLVV
ncbi:uncharacterized protein ACIB01_013456 isoform 1-T1 [Guaruba guarouba]